MADWFGSLSKSTNKTQAERSTKSGGLEVPFDALRIIPSTSIPVDMFGPTRLRRGMKLLGHPIATTCKWCGDPIRVKPSHARLARYCSKPCRAAGEFSESRIANSRPCTVCSKLVYRPPAHLARTPEGLFCSRECRGKWNVGARNSAYSGGKIKSCEQCGKTFRYHHRRNRYCSSTCSGAAERARTIIEWGAHRNCLHCNAPFTAISKIQKYCTRKCADLSHAWRMKGKGNGRYVHGDAQRAYPPGWSKSHKAFIRDRDGNQCRLCHREPEPGRHLDVHHIDYVKHNLRPSNLITLCRWCHGRMHGRQTQRRYWKGRLSSLLRGLDTSGQLTMFP